MPERIEMAVYDGLTPSEQDAIEHPTSFKSKEDAIAWGFDQGVFKEVQHAQTPTRRSSATTNPRRRR